MRIIIDASSLLVRSAGVKTFMFHWIRALRQLPAADDIRLFPFLGRDFELNHERSATGKLRTKVSTSLLHFCNSRYSNSPANGMLRLLTASAGVFHVSQHLRNPPRMSARMTATIYDMTCWLVPEMHTAANVDATKRHAGMVLRRAAACMAISESSRQDAIGILGLPAESVTVVYPGVADPFFSVTAGEKAAAKKAYGLEKPYVLFVGMIEPRKNIVRLIDSYLALPQRMRAEYDLVLAGPLGWCGPDAAERVQHPAQGVRYLGYVPERDLPGLTAGAAVFLYPSLYEGFGLPMAQAMACGVPVVTSNSSALAEIGGPDVMLADPHSVEAIEAALEQVLDSPSLAAGLGERARCRAELYRWERCARESQAFFHRAAQL
jgi:alpha-1,3-rhamnosyl/mannosyltransferase